jgi:lysophospholipase L1-like esterase
MHASALAGEPLALSFEPQQAHVLVSRDQPYDPGLGYGWEDHARFSIRVSEGTYLVTLEIGSNRAAVTTVKAENRRLMLEAVATQPNARVERSFVVSVRNPSLPDIPNGAPGGTRVRLHLGEEQEANWDDRLTLEFRGDPSAVRSISIRPVDVPTLYLLGDSTVADQPAEPAASWGQMLPRFLGPGIAVANHARSGETLKSFLTGLRLDKALAGMKPGDWAIIQFGHNDQKRGWTQTYAAAETTFRAYLTAYVAEIRLRGATPILATSPERRNFDAEGRIVPSHGDYPGAVRSLARELGVPLIDLTADTTKFYEALGPAAAHAFNDEGRDRTHHNAYGAYQIARMVAAGLNAEGGALGAQVLPEAQHYDPARPDDPATFVLAASVLRRESRPAGD